MQASLLTYICSGDITFEAFHTATFIKHMDTLFDIFNSCCLFDAKPFRCALKDGSPSFDYCKTMLCIFECLTVTALKTQPPCVIGWKLSINALLSLWEDVKILPNIQYLCTRNINQDPLENCFSVIRSQGGFM